MLRTGLCISMRPSFFVSFMGCCAVYSMSLRQQLQDPGRKPVAALHYNKGDKDVSPNGRYD